jgi:hypothetical protein
MEDMCNDAWRWQLNGSLSCNVVVHESDTGLKWKHFLKRIRSYLNIIWEILWFKPGEVSEILRKLRKEKPPSEIYQEITLGSVFLLFVIVCSSIDVIAGIIAFFLTKAAVKSLNRRSFFD